MSGIAAPHRVSPARRCVGCGASNLFTVETISAADIIAAWRREDAAAGQAAIADERSQALGRRLPADIRFDACPQCGLEMADPAVVWVSGEYPADQTYPVRWEFQQCLNDLGGTPLDVLEIGCGTGELLALAAERGHRAVGIDFSRSAVATAQARGLTAFAASLDDLAGYIPAGTRFDAAVVFHVIEHLTEPDTFLDAITRWLRPGARLFVSCPGPRRYTRLIGEQQCGRSDFWDYPPHHVLRWSIPALQAVAKRGGWRVLTVMEEPLSWVGAASHIGVARAMYRGRLSHPVGRRLSIAGAWASLLSAPRDRRSGVSLYLCAQRDN